MTESRNTSKLKKNERITTPTQAVTTKPQTLKTKSPHPSFMGLEKILYARISKLFRNITKPWPHSSKLQQLQPRLQLPPMELEAAEAQSLAPAIIKRTEGAVAKKKFHPNPGLLHDPLYHTDWPQVKVVLPHRDHHHNDHYHPRRVRLKGGVPPGSHRLRLPGINKIAIRVSFNSNNANPKILIFSLPS